MNKIMSRSYSRPGCASARWVRALSTKSSSSAPAIASPHGQFKCVFAMGTESHTWTMELVELYDAMRTTGAVRTFTGDPLSDDVLRRILDNARFAPSGGNRQGVRVVVVRDAATRRRLADLSLPAARRYLAQSGNGESPWNPVRPRQVDDATIARTDGSPMVSSLLDADVVLVVCLDLAVVAATDQELDRIGVVSGASVYPFVWNVLLAARNEGFGGVPTTMAVACESEVRALLGVPDDHAVASVIPLGKPVQQVTKLKRKSVRDIATREHFDGSPF